eukprot:jgi/Mesvir1/25503/Mv01757-RA.1
MGPSKPADSQFTGELNEEAKAFVAKSNSSAATPLYELPIAQSRPAFASVLQSLSPPKEQVAKVAYLFPRLPHGYEVPVRVYVPKRGLLDCGKLPVLLWYHGGGFIFGSPEEYDANCRHIANHAKCLVISVDYRLAPEHPFPAAYEDAFEALKWAAANCHRWGGDAATIGVAGDSAGGSVAVAVCRLTVERGGPKLACLSAVYPALDLCFTGNLMRYASPDYGLVTRPMINHFLECFTPNEADRGHPLNMAAQWDPEEVKKYIPRTFLLTAECDPFRADSERLAEHCAQAGVPVEHSCYAGAIHGLFSFAGAMPQQGVAAMNEYAEKTKALFAKYREEQAGWRGHAAKLVKLVLLAAVAKSLSRRKK